MEQKNACRLSLVMSSSHRLPTLLKSNKGAAVREKREELEEDKPQVGSNSSWSLPNLALSCHWLWVVFILSIINIIDMKSLTSTCFVMI